MSEMLDVLFSLWWMIRGSKPGCGLSFFIRVSAPPSAVLPSLITAATVPRRLIHVDQWAHRGTGLQVLDRPVDVWQGVGS